MVTEKFSLSLKEVINLSLDEIKKLPEQSRCGMLEIKIGKEIVAGARVIIILRDAKLGIPEILSKEYIIDKRGGIIVAELPLELLKALSEESNIKHIDKPSPLFPDLDDALKWSGAENLISQNLENQNPGFGNLDGNGVLIGILDSGINYLHPDFSHESENGLETIIEGIWRSDELQWNRGQINSALNRDNPQDIVPHLDDPIGHGTLVASCAASTGRGSNYRGVAPKAGLLIAAPNSFGNLETANSNNAYLNALSWFDSKSAELNKPIVINISKGSNAGPRDGSLPFEAYLDALIESNPAMVICKTAGNHANKKHHAQGNAKIDLEDSSHPTILIDQEIRSFELDIWYEAVDHFTLQLIDPNGNSSPQIVETTQNQVLFHFNNENPDNDDINIFLSYESENVTLNGAKHFHLLFNLRNGVNSLIQGQYQIKIIPVEAGLAPSGNYHCWLDWTGFSTRSSMEFLEPHLSSNSTLNAGACAQHPIIVGNWEDDTGLLHENSSKGPTRDGRIGLSILAPGKEIVGADSALDWVYSREAFLQIKTGTSFACPIVAGTVALIYQEAMLLNPNGPLPSHSEIKQRIMDHAWKDEHTGFDLPNANAGAGKLNANSIFNPDFPLQTNDLFISTEPPIALIAEPIKLVVKAIDSFHRLDSNMQGELNIQISNFDRGDQIISRINAPLLNGVFQGLLDLPSEAGHYKINVELNGQNLSKIHFLDVYQKQNSVEFTGPSLVPIGQAYPNNSFRHQFLFFNGNNNRLSGNLKAIAWRNAEGNTTRTGGWLNAKLKYGEFNGDYFNDFEELGDNNLARIQDVFVKDYGQKINKDLYPGALILFELENNFRLRDNNKPFLVELSYNLSLNTVRPNSIQQNSSVTKYLRNFKNNINGNLLSQSFSPSINEPLLLLDNRFQFKDVWLKASHNDSGREIIPISELGNSPDIIVRQNENLIKPSPGDHQEAKLNEDNFIYIRVRNRGGLDAENCQVSIFWTPMVGGLRSGNLMSDNFSFTNQNGQLRSGNSQSINLISKNPDNRFGEAFEQLKFRWQPTRSDLVDRNITEYALVVILNHPEDAPQFPEGGFEAHSKDNNLAFKRVELRVVEINFILVIWQRIWALIERLLRILGLGE